MTRVAILGTGLIGSSIGLRLRREADAGGRELQIVGHDRYRDSAKTAQKLGAIDRIESDPRKAVRDTSVVILSAPLLANRQLMEEIAPALETDTVVTDTGSTKAETLRWADEFLPPGVAFVGGHPMAGKTESGAQAADADLFEGARWVLIPTVRANENRVKLVTGLVESMGAEPLFMDAAEHDAYVAAISHLPMMLSIALYRLNRSSEAWGDLSLLAASGFKDVTRLAMTEPVMSYDITVTNREQILHWMDRFVEALHSLRAVIANAEDEEALFRLFAETEWDYLLFRNGRVGREEVSELHDIRGFDPSSFLMGEAMAEKMRDVMRGSEERLAAADERNRMRRNL